MIKTALWFGGVVPMFFGGLILPVGIFGEMVEGVSRWPGIIFGSICITLSVFCFLKLFTTNRRERKFSMYAAIIGQQKSVPIKWLAEKMKCNEDITIKNLREAMVHGMFTDGHIDERSGLLLFPNFNVHGASVTVICSKCGAGVKAMTGYYAQCPYCEFVLDTTKSI